MHDALSWNRALTLSERDFLHPTDAVPPGFDADLARQRLETWRQEAGLQDPAHFALRLEQQALDEERFGRLLGSPAPPLKESPPWLTLLEEAYLKTPRIAALDEFWVAIVEDQSDKAFLVVVRPLLDHAWGQFTSRLADLDDQAFAHSDRRRFAELWAQQLPIQALWMVSRTLILELYLSRIQNQLEGPTPEARFDSFIAPLSNPAGALEFLARYPVLGRSLATRFRQWVTTGVELAQRLTDDLPELAATFGHEHFGDLISLEPGLSDRHQDGRTVVVLGFSSGFKAVYKPRSLALDTRFQEVLEWLGEMGVEPRLRTLQVLDRGAYGWVEFVESAPCANEGEVRRFYRRQGIYLALLFALEATDFHHENLIAVGEYPVLIDLESLFQPVLADAELERGRLNPVFTTVLRSGLLPRQTGGGGNLEEVELSGLGATRGQRQPVRELTDVGTDQMGYEDLQGEYPVGNHLPRLLGEEIPLWSMRHVLREGFEVTYRKLQEHRAEFLRPGGWLDRFAGMETRVIVRPTQVYAALIYRSYHPDYLQDSLHRERFFDKLWLDADLLDWIPKLIPSERRDLLRDDFPRFKTRTDSRDVIADDFLLTDALPESGLDLTRRRFAALSEVDLQRQLALFDLAMASSRRLDETLEDDARAPRPLPQPSGDTSAGDFLSAARRLGERLEMLAFRAQDWISWFDLAPNRDASQALQPVGFDLYSGLSGIALFYAQLGRLTGEDRWTETARRALATARRRFETQPPKGPSYLGGYSGVGGWIYALTYLSVLWNEDELAGAAETARNLVDPAVVEDQGLDLIAGSAGCLVALLALQRHRPSTLTLDAAIACGDRLLAQATPQDHGIAWQLPHIAELPLTGFAHGTAGFAWALARLASWTGESRFDEGARSALAYERSLFSPENDNWPDLRSDRMTDGQWGFFHAWCHGAPGIGLSRLALLDVLEDEGLEGEIQAALRSTRKQGFGGSQCLCHGDLGNLELLTQAGQRFGDPELKEEAKQLAGRILAGLERDGSRCGLSSRVELPGLMTGLAGIGYGLLKVADPESMPSVLLLETPGS